MAMLVSRAVLGALGFTLGVAALAVPRPLVAATDSLCKASPVYCGAGSGPVEPHWLPPDPCGRASGPVWI